jgi:hypothetical protein
MVTLWNRSYIFSGKIKLPIVEQIICDAMEYDSYSTGEVILPPGHEALPPGQKPLSPSWRTLRAGSWGGAWAGGKRVEIAFLWGYAVDSTASLCNNGVKLGSFWKIVRLRALPFQ